MAISALRLPVFGQEPVYTRAQAAYQLGVTVETLMNWRKKNQGPAYYRFGRRFYYKESDIAAWAQRNKGGA